MANHYVKRTAPRYFQQVAADYVTGTNPGPGLPDPVKTPLFSICNVTDGGVGLKVFMCIQVGASHAWVSISAT